MSNKTRIDQEVLKILYYRYKDYVLPLAAFIASWLIFLQVVLPQIQNFLSVKDQVTASEQTLAVMTQNYNIIAAANSTELQTFLNTAQKALPPTKDFAGVLNAISTAAGLSGVIVNDYSFQIGDLTNNNTKGLSEQPSIELNITLNGTMDQTKKFLNALEKQLPLSEVTSVDFVSDGTAAIDAHFFYSPLPKINFVDTDPIPVLTAAEKKMLQSFNNSLANENSTPAITPLPTPTIILRVNPTPTIPISPVAPIGSASANQL